MERQIEKYFEEERGKRGGEIESYSLNETEQEGERQGEYPVRERERGGFERQSES